MAKSFKIGDALDSALNVAGNIASKVKNTDYKGIYADLSEAVKQTDEELAEVAKASLMKQITGSMKVPDSVIQETARQAGINDASFTRKVRELTSAMKSQDLSEAHRIAKEIDKQTGNKAFQDLVIQADIGVSNTLNGMKNATSDDIKRAWTSQFKQNTLPESLKNFTTDKNRDTIANFAYKVQGAKKYFSTDDPAINQKRLGVVAGGYVAATSGMRIINGGTPFTNEYGERDIAGIPFI